MSYTFQTKDMQAFKAADVSNANATPSEWSLSMLVEWLDHPLAMWIVPTLFGFALLVASVMWFSTLGTYYSTGLVESLGPVGVLGESLPLPY